VKPGEKEGINTNPEGVEHKNLNDLTK